MCNSWQGRLPGWYDRMKRVRGWNKARESDNILGIVTEVLTRHYV